ncbi:IclR family transcriptional regulator [Pseudalkalibacillus sp. A8]|uniref:IclR family transcriptional regulator n=1 Tax=Pseudalkalibacillus sp. A8 TaxID=3382641 RepID=UPI0038B47D8F
MSLKTLEHSLEILKYFTKEHPSWGVRELAKELGKSHSIVFRVLTTFENHGFLRQNPDTKKYELGLAFFEYGILVQDQLKIHDFIDPVMKELAARSNETVFLTWVDGTEGLCLSIAESSNSIKFAVSIGTRTPLYAGASCKAIMAFLSEESQQEIIETGLIARTKNTITDPIKLKEDLQAIREQGWCSSVGEYSDEVWGLGIPLFDHNNEVVASLTIAAPSYRITREKEETLLALLQEASREIERQLRTFQLSKKVSTF